MLHTKHEGLNRAELAPATDTIADRLLEALRSDYLNTLRAEGRIQQNPEEVFSSFSQLSQQMEGSGDSLERKHAAAKQSNTIMKDCAKPAAEEDSATSVGEEEEASRGGLPRDMCGREAEDNDAECDSPVEEAEPAVEFAYQRLPSVEELHSPQCFFDEAADENPSSSSPAASPSSAEGVWSGSHHATKDEDFSQAATAAEQQAARASSSNGSSVRTARASSFGSDEGKKGSPGFVAASDEEQEEEQQQPQPTRHRHLLLGERPLEPQAAAFIAEVMRGLALKDPRERAASDPAK
ncbi:hypothetical protein Esti_002906 [Eimeria stiedai]